MSNVFISYARPNETAARRMGEALRAQGFDVWWDEQLPTHRAYYEVIEERLREAAAVVVLWSREAAGSQWVRAEADMARGLGKLVQASADGTLPPMPFNQIQCAQLKGWLGAPTHREWAKVAASVSALVDAGTPKPVAAQDIPVDTARPRRRAMIGAAVTLVLALAGAGLFVGRHWLFRPEETAAPRVGVMAFDTLDGAAGEAAFAAALTDDLKGMLNENDVRTVAGAVALGREPAAKLRNLGARYLLGGSVRAEGNQLKVRAHLEDAATGITVWSEQFERARDQAGPLRDAVAVAATESARAAMAPLAQPGLRIDPETLALYIKIENATRNPQPATPDAPLRAAEQVVEREPRFAGAHAVLALNLVVTARRAPPTEAVPMLDRARKEVETAIRIHAPTAGAAYDARYMIAEATAPLDLAQREDSLVAGMRADPDFSFLPMRECRFLMSVGRLRAALTYCQRANALNPLAAPVAYAFAQALEMTGQEDLAQQIISKSYRYHPDHVQTRRVRFELAEFGGSPQAALDILNDPAQRPPNVGSPSAGALAVLMRARKSRTAADRAAALTALGRAVEVDRLDPRHLVLGAAALGDVDTAFEAMDRLLAAPRRAVSPGYDVTSTVLFEPMAAPLRRDPRFWPTAARLGLVDYWRRRKVTPDFCDDPREAAGCAAGMRTVATRESGA